MKRLAPLAFLLGCSGPPPKPLPFPLLGNATIEQALTPPQRIPSTLGATLLGPQMPEPGSYRIIYGASYCNAPLGMLPFISCRGVAPSVGFPWTIDMWTRSDIFPNDTAMTWLIIAWQPVLPAPLDQFGMPGCYLLASPEVMVEVPINMEHPLLQRPIIAPGRISLTWTPQGDSAGQMLWFQPVVAAPGVNTLGLLVGPALEVTVGG